MRGGGQKLIQVTIETHPNTQESSRTEDVALPLKTGTFNASVLKPSNPWLSHEAPDEGISNQHQLSVFRLLNGIRSD